MIDAGKLLGGLLGGGASGLGSLGILGDAERGGMSGSAAVGLGLLGVAMAAFEHFAEQQTPPPVGSPSGGQAQSHGMTPPPLPGVPPAPPSAPTGTSVPLVVPGLVPPPPIASSLRVPVPSVTLPSPVASATQADPMLLIRAMIASANADGQLDETERIRILGQLEGGGLSEAEKDFLCGEFDRPWSPAALANAASSPAVAAQVYTVSLLAIDVDTQEERDYLERLRQMLGLESTQVMAIARRLGKSV